MSILMRALILPLTMILLAGPALAEPPGKAKKADGAQSAKEYAPGHNKDDKDKGKHKEEDYERDCGDIKNDDARKRCREEKYDRKHSESKYDCSDIKDDSARKRCREEKRDRNYGDREHDCSDIKDYDARKRCREEKSSRNEGRRGEEECDSVKGNLERIACLEKYRNKNKEKR